MLMNKGINLERVQLSISSIDHKNLQSSRVYPCAPLPLHLEGLVTTGDADVPEEEDEEDVAAVDLCCWILASSELASREMALERAK